MVFAGGLLGVALLLVWLFCIIDVILTPDGECRGLPKLLWLAIVVLLGDIGSAVWLLAGRPWPGGPPLARLLGTAGEAGRDQPHERLSSGRPEDDRAGRSAATNPDDDEAFLAHVRERAQAQRRAEADRRREHERAENAERERRARESDGGAEEPHP